MEQLRTQDCSEPEIHRRYCNSVKKAILRDAVAMTQMNPKDIRLLDMACGRGGDIFKWNDLGIGLVFAFDIDADSVREAIGRCAANRKKLTTQVRFYETSVYSCKFIRHTILRGTKVNVVTCMFALHYFCESERSLTVFLRNVSEFLEEGGVFIGIAPDPKYISKAIASGSPNSHVTIEGGGTPNSYRFSIRDPTQNDYFSFRGTSYEYLVPKESFVRIAGYYGLRCVRHNNMLRETMPNIYDDYPPHNFKLSTISQLYFSFCFVKSSGPSE